jgi:hypothetical protein
MLELIVTVADRLVSLFKAGQERDRKLYDDFLVEFASSMETLHQNYLETFSAYRDGLGNTAVVLNAQHPLIGEIEKDSLFTDQLRAKIRSLSDYEKDPVFGKVAKAAAAYLLGGPACANVLVNGRKLLNAPRGSAVTGLRQIFAQPISDEEKLAAATQLLDRIVEDIQLEYSSFLRAFTGAKRELLDRRM